MNTLAHVTSSFALALVALAGCAAPTGGGEPATESAPVRIDEASIAAGNARIDLTQPVVYEIVLPASARERVVVHTAKEDRSLSEHLKTAGVSPSIDTKVIRLSGDPKMLTSNAAPNPSEKLMAGGGGGGGLSFACSPFSCSCTGDTDCNDMFESGVCGGDAICIDDGCYCWRWGRLTTR